MTSLPTLQLSAQKSAKTPEMQTPTPWHHLAGLGPPASWLGGSPSFQLSEAVEQIFGHIFPPLLVYEFVQMTYSFHISKVMF